MAMTVVLGDIYWDALSEQILHDIASYGQLSISDTQQLALQQIRKYTISSSF
jgi:hypothetical protein